MKIAIIKFPGPSAAERMLEIFSGYENLEPIIIWHKNRSLPEDIDAVVIADGASFADHKGPGVMAASSNIMDAISKKADQGKLVIGIGNGFQILTERRLLPGKFEKNANGRFICKDIFVRIDNNKTKCTGVYEQGQIARLKVAAEFGKYVLDEEEYLILEGKRLILASYCDESGNVTEEANIFGSTHNVAAVANRTKNVLGFMPRVGISIAGRFNKCQGKNFFDCLSLTI